nr:vicilin-like seed storage protein At2g18540 [Penaeus vannamei]
MRIASTAAVDHHADVAAARAAASNTKTSDIFRTKFKRTRRSIERTERHIKDRPLRHVTRETKVHRANLLAKRSTFPLKLLTPRQLTLATVCTNSAKRVYRRGKKAPGTNQQRPDSRDQTTESESRRGQQRTDSREQAAERKTADRREHRTASRQQRAERKKQQEATSKDRQNQQDKTADSKDKTADSKDKTADSKEQQRERQQSEESTEQPAEIRQQRAERKTAGSNQQRPDSRQQRQTADSKEQRERQQEATSKDQTATSRDQTAKTRQREREPARAAEAEPARRRTRSITMSRGRVLGRPREGVRAGDTSEMNVSVSGRLRLLTATADEDTLGEVREGVLDPFKYFLFKYPDFLQKQGYYSKILIYEVSKFFGFIKNRRISLRKFLPEDLRDREKPLGNN